MSSEPTIDKNAAQSLVSKVFDKLNSDDLGKILSFAKQITQSVPMVQETLEQVSSIQKMATDISALKLSEDDLRIECERMGKVFIILVTEVEIKVMVEVDKFIRELAKTKTLL